MEDKTKELEGIHCHGFERKVHPHKIRDHQFNQVFKSITFDNGSEFCLWREMEAELGIEAWFGRPYHSCDRGSNENCNGFVRRYIPKGTDINSVDAAKTR